MLIRSVLMLYILSCIDAQFPPIGVLGSCRYPRLENGMVRIRQKAKLVKFVCLRRYELVGNKYATCRDGQWDVPLPVCVRPGCTRPEIKNGVQMPMRQGAWVVYFCLPGHKLIGSSTIYCDGNKWNGTAPACVDATNPSPPSCDFEDAGLCGWRQDELHDFDWRRLNKKTPSSFLLTGPSYDHTYGKGGLGYYMYIESTSRLENDTARLISPIYNESLAVNGCFSFFYHMFGIATGGLRVYQKPESITIQAILYVSDSERQKYLLFEKWGNQGDFWYSAVAKLKTDFSDNFQIVIEGIRGPSFTSDIAIDDVAILQGENCTAAANSATTPSTVVPDSCSGRCDVFGEAAVQLGCGCTASCVTDRNCCPDFFEICVFTNTETTTSSDDNPTTSSNHSVELPPQTQKLVATTVELSSTTTSSTTKANTPTSTTKPTTTTAATTTSTKPSTKVTKASKTTPKVRLPTLVFKSTTPIYNATGKLQKDKSNKTEVITKFSTTTTKAVPTTKSMTTTKSTSTTNLPFGISRTLENHNVYHEMVDKARKEQKIEKRKPVSEEVQNIPLEDSKSTKSGIKTTIIVIVLLLCCACAAWVGVAARSARGRVMLARLRGRTRDDPEVRYLSADVDDD